MTEELTLAPTRLATASYSQYTFQIQNYTVPWNQVLVIRFNAKVSLVQSIHNP